MTIKLMDNPAASVGRTRVTPMNVAIVGAGYTGTRLARVCLRQGADVIAMTRAPQRQAELTALGARCVSLDLDSDGAAAAFSGDRHRRSQTCSIWCPRPMAVTGIRASAGFSPRSRTCPRRPACLVYLSTTAVYGDCGGQRVDERSPGPSRPATAAGGGWMPSVWLWTGVAAHGVPVRVLRVPGIYGPGRLPLARLAAGASVARDEPSPRPGNRIHVDDLVGVCLAASAYRGAHRVFNVGDGNHASMGEYFRRVAAIAGLPAPEELDMETLLARSSPMMRSFLQESRRLDTGLMRSELGYQPRYQDLDQGIEASLREDAEGG